MQGVVGGSCGIWIVTGGMSRQSFSAVIGGIDVMSLKISSGI